MDSEVPGRDCPRNVTRDLAEARERLGFGWVTAHSWRETIATVLDSSGASARMIADQPGHSRVSMSLDFYLGRKSADPRVLAALEAADPIRFTIESGDQSDGFGDQRDHAKDILAGQRADEGT